MSEDKEMIEHLRKCLNESDKENQRLNSYFYNIIIAFIVIALYFIFAFCI